MNEHLQKTCAYLQERFNVGLHEFRDQVSLVVNPNQIVDVARNLRDEFSFEMLKGLSAVDYWPQEGPRFHLIYIFYSLAQALHLVVRVPLTGNAPSVPTLSGVYPNANWHERETYDLFGIHFADHPDLRRIIMPADWEGHPLRKDYPLGYEEVQFSFNYDEIDARKPYAKE